MSAIPSSLPEASGAVSSASSRRRARVLVSGLGSWGDVGPVLAVAGRLRAEGNEVRLLLPETYAPRARRLGFDPGIYPMDIEALSRRMGRSVVGMAQVFRWFLESVEPNAEVMIEHADGVDVVLTSTAELHASSVAEHLGLPHYRMLYAPVLPGNQTPPVLPLPELPAPVNRALWIGMNEGVLVVLGHHLNRLRRRLGLRPARSFSEYLHRRCHTILAISELLGPRDPSWDWDYRYTGYCFGDEPRVLPDRVEEFLEGGDRPVYLGLGSMTVTDPERFWEFVLEAGKRAGVRLVVSGGWMSLDPRESSGRVLVVDDLPHGALFPRLAGVCHHGGSGTTHRAAHAGVPQLVMPFGLDQHYWARRVRELGLGPGPMSVRALEVDALARAFWSMARGERAETARRLGEELALEDGTEAAARLVGEHFRGKQRCVR